MPRKKLCPAVRVGQLNQSGGRRLQEQADRKGALVLKSNGVPLGVILSLPHAERLLEENPVLSRSRLSLTALKLDRQPAFVKGSPPLHIVPDPSGTPLYGYITLSALDELSGRYAKKLAAQARSYEMPRSETPRKMTPKITGDENDRPAPEIRVSQMFYIEGRKGQIPVFMAEKKRAQYKTIQGLVMDWETCATEFCFREPGVHPNIQPFRPEKRHDDKPSENTLTAHSRLAFVPVSLLARNPHWVRIQSSFPVDPADARRKEDAQTVENLRQFINAKPQRELNVA